MDVNISDQNGKPLVNLSAEEIKEQKERPKGELPPILRPKFVKNQRPTRSKVRLTSKELATKEEDVGVERLDTLEKLEKATEDKDDEKVLPDRLSAEKVEPDEGKDSKEKEYEDQDGREVDVRITTAEAQNSDPDNRKASMSKESANEKSDENKKKKMDTLDDAEKAAVRKELRKDTSRHKKRPKNGGKASVKRFHMNLSNDRKRRKKLPSKESLSKDTSQSPTGVSLDKSQETVGRGKRSHNKGPDLAIKTSAMDTTRKHQRKKFNTFFKNIFEKTRSWMRKSDDVAQPTKEMLFKSYVLPEYDSNNAADFLPDPHSLFSEDEWKARVKNQKSEREEVFINNRPFWVHRTTDDVIPKCKLLSHNGLVAQHALNNSCFLKELPKRSFYDPKSESMEKLTSVDKMLGIDPMDISKEKELKRVASNTFYGTCLMQANRKCLESKRKAEDADLKTADDKKSGYGVKVTFLISDKNQTLHLYSRKDRPAPGDVRRFSKVDTLPTDMYRKHPSKTKTHFPQCSVISLEASTDNKNEK